MKALRAIVALAVLLAAIGSPVLPDASMVYEARTSTGSGRRRVSGSDLARLAYPAFGPPEAA